VLWTLIRFLPNMQIRATDFHHIARNLRFRSRNPKDALPDWEKDWALDLEMDLAKPPELD